MKKQVIFNLSKEQVEIALLEYVQHFDKEAKVCFTNDDVIKKVTISVGQENRAISAIIEIEYDTEYATKFIG